MCIRDSFHVAQPVRERGLRHVHGFGGAGDAARGFQGGQHLQVPKLEPAVQGGSIEVASMRKW